MCTTWFRTITQFILHTSYYFTNRTRSDMESTTSRFSLAFPLKEMLPFLLWVISFPLTHCLHLLPNVVGGGRMSNHPIPPAMNLTIDGIRDRIWFNGYHPTSRCTSMGISSTNRFGRVLHGVKHLEISPQSSIPLLVLLIGLHQRRHGLHLMLLPLIPAE